MATRDQVVVVGAGLGGLAAAIRLAAAGRDVTVVEASDVPGGCCGTATLGPYRFDTGPSVLTMPSVLADTFGAAGEELDDWLPLRRLDPYYRFAYHDGSVFDVVRGQEAMAEQVRELCGPAEAARYLRFRRRLQQIFDVEWPLFIDHDMTRLRAMVRPYALARLAASGGFRRLDRLVRSCLTDERLIRAHTFQALYLGLSPRKALGVYASVAHMDTVGGVFFPRHGGMHAIPVAMAAVAEKAGAVIRYGVRATKVEADGSGVTAVRLDTGERLQARHAVVACDLPAAHQGLLPDAAADWRLRRPSYSPSCLVLHFGLDRRLPDQAHHTLHLGEQWDSTFAALEEGRPQPDPSLLVTYPSSDTGAAPAGHATLTVLEPTANLRGGLDWDDLGPRLRDRLLDRLTRLGYGDLSTTPSLTIAPPDWLRRGHSAGTPFALDHRFTQTAWLRPSGRARRVPGLHFAGMYTAPGVGVPPVLISGRLAAERVLEGRR
ncbi:phytoene desaturase family protein [Sphaerisporangium rubeum]|uniref:Phytoene desaturase n=1 Tax=Sphaerisporangium rubeum TaxID=321317 RepID=A0A7X0IJZ5_9ACTN|nr:phytoene desaturase family protein [Sphaerisporangium rubeum]MBB6475393.1 phytoene desaturase [Sphaerisporangium rubeum]